MSKCSGSLNTFNRSYGKTAFPQAAFEKLARARLSLTDLPFPAQQRKMIVTAPRNRLPIGLENKYICRSNNELQEVGRRHSTGIWEEQSNSKRRFEMYISNGMHGGVRGRSKFAILDTKFARQESEPRAMNVFQKQPFLNRKNLYRAQLLKNREKDISIQSFTRSLMGIQNKKNRKMSNNGV